MKLVFYNGKYSELDFGDAVDILGKGGFYKNDIIRKVSGSAVKLIEEGAFYKSTIEAAKFINLEELGSYAFSCSCLQEINVPKIRRIEDKTFDSCFSLKKVTATNCSYLGLRSFSHCDNLKEVTLPSCKMIDALAFEDSLNLEKLIVSDEVCIINNAFEGIKRDVIVKSCTGNNIVIHSM